MVGQEKVSGRCARKDRREDGTNLAGSGVENKIGIIMAPCRGILGKDIEKSGNHFRCHIKSLQRLRI